MIVEISFFIFITSNDLINVLTTFSSFKKFFRDKAFTLFCVFKNLFQDALARSFRKFPAQKRAQSSEELHLTFMCPVKY